MSSIFVIGTLWLILAGVIIAILLKMWNAVAEFFVFNKNPEQFLHELYTTLEPHRASLPELNMEELSLLSSNTNLVQTKLLGQDTKAGYIRNVYQENLAIYAFRQIGVHKRLFVFADKTGIFAFRELSKGTFRVFDERVVALGDYNPESGFIWKASAIGNLDKDAEGRLTTMRIGQKQVANFVKKDNLTKVPQRHFSFIQNDEITRNTTFRILMFASLMDSVQT